MWYRAMRALMAIRVEAVDLLRDALKTADIQERDRALIQESLDVRGEVSSGARFAESKVGVERFAKYNDGILQGFALD